MTSVSPPRAGRARRMPLRDRLSLASRCVAALFGAYALAALTSALLALALPLPREEAVTAGFLAAFLVIPASVLWVFAASTARRAWFGLLAPGAVLAVAVWLLERGAA